MKPGDRVAVIGGGGFIGRPLVACLRRAGALVRIIGTTGSSGEGVDWVRCDVRDGPGVAAALEGITVVYNLAAAHGLNTWARDVYESINVAGARAVCEALNANGISRLVFTSSADVYGEGPVFNEDSPLRPLADYGRTKVKAEAVYRDWAGTNAGHSLAIVRPTVVFGPGDQGAVARFIRHAAGPGFQHVGAGTNRRSLACVENLAAFLAFLAEAPGDGVQVFNYADEPDLTVAEIVAVVREAIGVQPAPHRSIVGALTQEIGDSMRVRLGGRPRGPRPGLRTLFSQLSLERRLDARRAHGSGFKAPVPLRDALALTARTDARWVAWLSRAEA